MLIEEHMLGEIYARRYRNDNAKYALVISHGLGGHGSMYDRFGTHHSARGVDIWSYDGPGHGKSTSTRPRGQFTIEEWIEAGLAYASHVKAETGLPVFLLGSSLGVGPAYCGLASDIVQGAILMGAATVPGTPTYDKMALPLRGDGIAQLIAGFGRAVRFDVANFISYDEDYGYRGAEDQKRLDPYITWSYDLSSFHSYFNYEPEVPPSANQKPILVASGSQDAMFSVEQMKKTASAIGGPVEYKSFEDGAHQLLMFDTERFSDAVDAFVRSHM